MSAFFKNLVFLLVFLMPIQASFADGSRALKLLEKQEYEKLIDHLNKSLEKDSLNPGARYVYSLLYLDSAFSRFDIDTSYQYINSAIKNLSYTEEKEVGRLAKDGITEPAMYRQKAKVEKAGYNRARQIHTLKGYDYYIDNFQGAEEIDSAIYHRNAIAYRQAVKKNTYQAFQDFIYTYPNAIQIEKAKENYERLLFQSQTEDGRLDTYIRFLKNNPDTPHRKEAERNIFEIVTADNAVSSYVWFLENFPHSVWRKKNLDYLYHKYKDISGPQGFLNRFSSFVLSDSLKKIATADEKTIFPVYEDKKYGFTDENGHFLIPLKYDSVKAQLLCGNITQDFLEVTYKGEQEIVGRLGGKVYEGRFNEVSDIGSGLLKVNVGGKYGLVHKSGDILIDFDFDDIELLNSTFVKIKLGEKWGLTSLTGRKLLDVDYDEIEAEGNFILIKKGEYYAVQNVSSLKKAAEGDKPALFFSFGDYILMDDSHLLIIAGESETLIDDNLQPITKTEHQEIYKYFGGWLAKSADGYRVYDFIYYPLSDKHFSDVQKSSKKLAMKFNGKWGIYYQGNDFPVEFEYDSVRFLGDKIGIVTKDDKTFASYNQDTLIDISGSQEIKLIRPQISNLESGNVPEYLLVKNKRGNYSVFNALGQEILEGRFDDVEALGYEYLLVTKNGRKGLYHKSGKELLKTSYQAIGNYNHGYVSTLLNNKFGIYNYNKNELLLSAKHDKLLKIYNDKYFISEKNGRYAFVDLDNDLVSDYNFLKVENWNDSVALVKKEDFWALYDIKNRAYTFDEIEIVNPLTDYSGISNDEKFLFVTKKSQEGVLSNKRGVVIGSTFNDIYNIGTIKNPVFFAEKYIPEAEFYIIIYYDKTGQIVRKQVFTGDEYWKVYCND